MDIAPICGIACTLTVKNWVNFSDVYVLPAHIQYFSLLLLLFTYRLRHVTLVNGQAGRYLKQLLSFTLSHAVVSPWHHIGIDFIGPISPPSTNGSQYILMISDYFTKFVQAFPTDSKHACCLQSLFGKQWQL